MSEFFIKTSGVGGGSGSSPLTTKGDIYTRDASADARLPVGTNGQALFADSAETTGIKWDDITTPNVAVRSESSAYTATITDYVILLDSSGGTFTVTLPAASGNTGKVFVFKKTDSSLTAVTIDGDGAETIDGETTTTLDTQYETLTIVCDGSNWEILNRKTIKAAISGGTVTFDAVTTAPTKPNTVDTDIVSYHREGEFAVISYYYQADSGTGGTTGSGDYIIRLPSTLTMNTSHPSYVASTGSALDDPGAVVGLGSQTGASLERDIAAVIYDSTGVRLIGEDSTTNPVVKAFLGTQSSTRLNANNILYAFTIKVPISGWNA